jgi:hypothetical protein
MPRKHHVHQAINAHGQYDKHYDIIPAEPEPAAPSSAPQSLLAVDLGLHTGLACYDTNGKLCWYRSHHFGTPQHLRRGIPNILKPLPQLQWIIVEGGGELALLWEREATRHKINYQALNAETWRNSLLYPREQRSGQYAKAQADTLARRIINWSGIAKPSSLRHDTAEAILVGLWAVYQLGWIDQIPAELRQK